MGETDSNTQPQQSCRGYLQTVTYKATDEEGGKQIQIPRQRNRAEGFLQRGTCNAMEGANSNTPCRGLWWHLVGSSGGPSKGPLGAPRWGLWSLEKVFWWHREGASGGTEGRLSGSIQTRSSTATFYINSPKRISYLAGSVCSSL